MLVEVGRGLLTTCNGKEGVSREGRRSRAVPGRVRRRGTQSTGLGVRPGSGRERAGRGPGAGEAAGALPLWQEGQAGRVADGDRALTAAPSLSRALCVGDSTGRRRGRGGLRAGKARGRAVSAGKSGRLPGGGDLGLRLGGRSGLGRSGREESRSRAAPRSLPDSGLWHLSSPQPFVRGETRLARGLRAG